jgi:hypothetical protein
VPPADRRYLISLPNALLLTTNAVLIITCLFLYLRTSAPRGVLIIPVSDRVRGVVLMWSQDTSVADGDKLETIWGRTRTSGNHDYDYSPGGIYDLNRLLAVEFSHPPQKTIPPVVAFGSTGRIKTFADLVDAMQQ